MEKPPDCVRGDLEAATECPRTQSGGFIATILRLKEHISVHSNFRSPKFA